MTISLLFLRMALARQISYFYPTENTEFTSVMSVFRPFISMWSTSLFSFLLNCFLTVFSSFSMYVLKFTSERTFKSSSSLNSLNGSRFLRMVPLNTKGYCGIIDIFLRSKWSPTSQLFTPEKVIFPYSSSVILNRLYSILLFPAPVLPIHPTFSPWLISKLTPFSTKSPSSLYLIYTSENWISPVWGHPSLSTSFSITAGSS